MMATIMSDISRNYSIEACPSHPIQDVQTVVMKMDLSNVGQLLGLMRERDINVLREPATALVMMCAKDSFDTDFCLGEILVTEAEVEFAGNKGYAMVLGDEPDRSLAVASANAVFQGNDNDLQHAIRNILKTQAAMIAETEEIERNLAASTRVNFENMVKG